MKYIILIISAIILIFHFVNIEADFPPCFIDGGFPYTDEGWYSNAAFNGIVKNDISPSLLMPIHSIIRVPLFYFFGSSLALNRSITVLFLIATIILVGMFAYKKYGLLSSSISILYISCSWHLFAYSRIGQSEIEAMFFIMLSVILADSRRSFLSGIAISFAMLTKTSAIFSVIPIALFFYKDNKNLLMYFIAFFVAYIPIIAFSYMVYPIEFVQYFKSNFITDRSTFSLLNIYNTLIKSLSYNIQCVAIILCFLFSFNNNKKYSTVLFSMVFIFVVMLSCNVYHPNRYFLFLMLPTALMLSTFVNNLNKFQLSFLIIIILLQIVDISVYVFNPTHELRNMAYDIKVCVKKDKLCGLSANTISLATGIKSVGILSDTLLNQFEPDYYLHDMSHNPTCKYILNSKVVQIRQPYKVGNKVFVLYKLN
ncbi:MAG: glycosyltransferase 87 family protein [Lutibacter sp.]|jgi:hypothetical protein